MTPLTQLTFYCCKLDISNKSVLYVTSAEDALSKLSSISKTFLHINDSFWQRDDYLVRVPYNIETLREFNYCTYKNPTGRDIFAFITDLTYVNDDLTYVNIVTDPWMTYSYDCIFGYSLMQRCHPEADEEENVDNYFTETINPLLTPDVDVAELEGSSKIYITSQVDTFSLALNLGNYPDVYTDWLKYCNTISGGNANNYYNWWSGLDVSSLSIGGIPQRPTFAMNYIADNINTISLLVKYLNECNLSNLLVSFYVVPAGFNPNYNGQLAAITYDFYTSNITINKSWDDDVYWKKIYYTPQFNRLIYRFCGRDVEIPFERIDSSSLKDGDFNCQFQLIVDWSENGCAYLKPVFIRGQAEYTAASPGWDKISFEAFSGKTLSTLTEQYNANINRVKKIVGAVTAGIGLGMGLNNISGSVGSLLQEQSNAYFESNNFLPTAAGPFGSNAVNKTTKAITAGAGVVGAGVMASKQLEPWSSVEIPSSASSIGTQSSSLIGLAASQDLISVDHQYPHGDSMKRLNDYFSMWGYDQGGMLHGININPGALFWKYYKTIDCNIIGDCAQKYIDQIKSMFNSGIFIFKNSPSYKNFSNVSDNHY